MQLKLKPASVIKASLGIQPNGPVHAYFTDRCADHMDKYVPYSGDYANRTHLRENIEKGTNYIKYNQLYASYQYYGERADGTHKITHYTTPGTGTYWDRRMWSAEKSQVIAEVQDYVNRGGK